MPKECTTTGRQCGAIYSVAPRDWVLHFMAQRDLELTGSHFVPLSGGRTELLVFERR